MTSFSLPFIHRLHQGPQSSDLQGHSLTRAHPPQRGTLSLWAGKQETEPSFPVSRSCPSWLSRVWQSPLCQPLQGQPAQPGLESSSVCFNTVKSSTREQDTRVSTQEPQTSLRVLTLKLPNKSEQLVWYFAYVLLTNLWELSERERFDTKTHTRVCSAHRLGLGLGKQY